MPDRRVSVGIDADVSPFIRSLTRAGVATKGFAHELESADGRLSNIVQTSLALAPAFVPLAAAAVPAIAGLTSQLGFAVAAAGVSVIAFNGIGDALDAVNKAQLEPTAENVGKMNNALAEVGASGAAFVQFLQSIRPQMSALQDVARDGLFPGVQDGLTELMDLLPEAEQMIGTISSTLGNLVADAGDNLNDDRWVDFFRFLDREAGPTLTAMGKTLGNVVDGLASMIVAFDPLADDFTGGMLNMSRSFAEWADGLDSSESFQEFVSYVREATPQALGALGALADMLVSFTKAAAPVGSIVLPIIEGIAKGFAAIADTSFGTALVGAAAAIGVLGRSMALWDTVGGSAIGKTFKGAVAPIREATTALGTVTSAQDRARLSVTELAAAEEKRAATMRAGLVQMGKAAALVGGFAVMQSGLAEKTGLSNTASLALMGTLAGPWGAAMGAGAGLAMDLAAANDNFTTSLARAQAALTNSSAGFEVQQAAVENTREEYAKLKADLDDTTWLETLNPFEGTDKNMWEGIFGKSDLEEAKAALDGLDDALDDTSGATDAFTGVTDRNTDGIINNTDAILANIDAMREKRSEAISAFDAETAYAKALDDSKKAIAENGKTLDKNTEAGRANRGALSAQAAAWNNLSPAAKNAAGAHRNAVKAFEATAVAMGMDADKAHALAQRLLEIKPRDVKVSVNTSGARADVENLISSLTGRVIGIGVRVGSTETPSWLHNSQGRVVNYFADGTEDHVAQIAPAGAFRVWAEPETGGEAYIPLSPAKRDRSLDIWQEVGKRLGVAGFAPGGIVTGVTAKERRKALDGLNITVDLDTSEVRDELKAFRKDIHDAGGTVTSRFDDFSARLIASSKELDSQRKALEDSKDALKSMRDAAASMADSVAQMFQRDIFGSDSGQGFETLTAELPDNFADLTVAEQRDAREKQRDEQAKLDRIFAEINAAADKTRRLNMLTNDIGDAGAFRDALRTVDRKDGKGTSAFYKDLAASGNVEQAQFYAGLSRKDLRQYVSLYAERAQVATGVGAFAAHSATSADIKELVAENRELRKVVASLADARKGIFSDAKIDRLATKTGQATGRALNNAAANAGRKKAHA